MLRPRAFLRHSARRHERHRVRRWIHAGAEEIRRPRAALSRGARSISSGRSRCRTEALSSAKFRVFQVAVRKRLAACAFRLPAQGREKRSGFRVMKHANGAKESAAGLIVSPEPAKDAAPLARSRCETRAEPDGAVAVHSGSDSCRFRIPHQGSVGRPIRSLAGGRTGTRRRGHRDRIGSRRGGRRRSDSSGVSSGSAVCVAPAAANGTCSPSSRVALTRGHHIALEDGGAGHGLSRLGLGTGISLL